MKEIIFLDNERHNLTTTAKIGVTGVYTPDGVTRADWCGACLMCRVRRMLTRSIRVSTLRRVHPRFGLITSLVLTYCKILTRFGTMPCRENACQKFPAPGEILEA